MSRSGSVTGDDVIRDKLRKLAGDGDIVTMHGTEEVVHNGKRSEYVKMPEGSDRRPDVEGYKSKGEDEIADPGGISKINEFSSTSEGADNVVYATDVEGEDFSADPSREVADDDKTNDSVSKTAFADRDNDEVDDIEDITETVEDKMTALGISKDQVMEMILQLTDDGFIEEALSFFKGRITIVLRSANMRTSSEFMMLLDDESLQSPAKIEYFLSLYSAAAVLEKYNDTDLSQMSVAERVDWIEVHVPTVIFKIINEKITAFHKKIEILGSDEVANFF